MAAKLGNSYCRANFESAEVVSNDFGHIAVYTKPAPYRLADTQDTNQDSVAVCYLPCGASIIAVADGVGGQKGGAEASEIAVSTLLEKVKPIKSLEHLTGAIVDSIEVSNAKIQDLGIGAGSTVVIASISAYEVRFYSVGDSAAFVFGGQGKLKYRTIEHSEVGFAVEAGLIDSDNALEQSNRNIILNALGYPDMRMELSPPIKLAAKDTIFLATDGILDNLSPTQISENICAGPIQTRANRIVALAEQNMQSGSEFAKEDDVSVALYQPKF